MLENIHTVRIIWEDDSKERQRELFKQQFDMDHIYNIRCSKEGKQIKYGQINTCFKSILRAEITHMKLIDSIIWLSV